jgi:hypothetical protein
LGAESSTVESPQELLGATKVAEAHLNTLDQIVAMSHQPTLNCSTASRVSSAVSKLKAHRSAVSVLLLLAIAFGFFVMHDLQSRGDATPLASLTPEQVQQSQTAAAAVAPVAASEPAVLASVAVPNKTMDCAYVSGELPQLSSSVAQKEGRYVYVVSTSNVEVCVVDGNKQATVLQLKSGENRSVYGVSPWQVSSPQLAKIEIFFQGGRVSLPDAATRVKLLEVPISH